MLRITVNTGNLSDKLEILPSVVKDALLAEMRGIAGFLLGIVKAKAGGEVLQVHTGSYLDSFQAQVKENPKSVTGKVFTQDPRGGVLEWGGHTPPRVIAAKNVKALHFLAGSGEVFAAVVHNPGAQIKPHSVMHSTYLEEKDEVAARLIATATQAATEGW